MSYYVVAYRTLEVVEEHDGQQQAQARARALSQSSGEQHWAVKDTALAGMRKRRPALPVVDSASDLWSLEDVAALKDTSLSYEEVAERVGRSLNAVYNKAHRLGVLRAEPGSEPAWLATARPPFGTMPDAELAVAVGVSKATIVRWRTRLNVAPYQRPLRRPAWLDEGEVLLGTMSDRKVATRFDVSIDHVGKWRRRLGIPAWQLNQPKREVRRRQFTLSSRHALHPAPGVCDWRRHFGRVYPADDVEPRGLRRRVAPPALSHQ